MFLGVFLFTLLGTAVPHTQHTHTGGDRLALSYETKHQHSTQEHHHGDVVHHQHHVNDGFSLSDGFLSADEHSHSGHLHEFSSIINNKTAKIKGSDFQSLMIVDAFEFEITLKQQQHFGLLRSDKHHSTATFLYPPLRGPPLLG